MNKFFIVISLLLLSKVSFSQTGSAVWDSAIAIEDRKQYLEAIEAYKKALDFSDSSYRNAFIYSRIATCNEKLGNKSLQKEYLRLSINVPAIAMKKIERGMKLFWTRKLANIWFEEKKYDSAIYYYKKADPFNLNYGIGSAHYNIESGFNRFLCYKFLGEFDSAFIYFTPLALDSTIWSADSVYEGMINQYYNLLLTKYSKKEIKKSFIKGCKKLDFAFIAEKDTAYDGKEYFGVDNKAIFEFLGKKFDLRGNNGSRYVLDSDKDIEKQLPGMNKEYYLQQLRSSCIYKLIMSQ